MYCVCMKALVYRGTSLITQETHPPRTLPQACAWGRRGFIWGWAFYHGRSAPVNTLKEVQVLTGAQLGGSQPGGCDDFISHNVFIKWF
jgi:hypothetical protein